MHLLHRQRSKGARISHHHHHLYEKKTDPRSIIKVYNYDSDDEIGYEDVDVFGMHEMTDKEYKEYSMQIEESEGFDVMDFPESFSCGKIIPIIDFKDHANYLKTRSELALKEYNEKENTKLEFLKLVKANSEACECRQSYITFDTTDADAVDGPILTFQALELKYCFIGWKLVINQEYKARVCEGCKGKLGGVCWP